jgi:hypothetical protein
MPSLISNGRIEQPSIVLPEVPWPASHWKQIVLVEDNSARSQRRRIAGVGPRRTSADVVLRLHKITQQGIVLMGERIYLPGTLTELVSNGGKAALALQLLDEVRTSRNSALVVAGPN